MAATTSADFRFEPKVWADHTGAYFDTKLVYGAFAVRNNELEMDGKGTIVNFPYYKTIGKAQEIEENESLDVDNLRDDSFSASVFEVGKAVGIKKKAFKKSADKQASIMAEAQRQIARRHAEFVDEKLNDEITSYNNNPGGAIGNTAANYNNLKIGFTSSSSASEQRMNIRNLHVAKSRVFGDKADGAVVCFMHPMQYLDSRLDATSGFLKADANMPYSGINGFVGMLAGMALIQTETVKRTSTDIGGKPAYLCHFHKVNAFGIIQKQEMEFDTDKDILARQWVITGNQWYGVKSFHEQISDDDTKSGGMITAVEYSLA